MLTFIASLELNGFTNWFFNLSFTKSILSDQTSFSFNIKNPHPFLSSLQKFKLTIANTVISQDNSSLQTMDTGQLLDLFSVEKQGNETKHEALRESEKSKASLKSMLEDMGKLWDEDQYEAEYNLDNFIEKLK